MVGPPLPPPPPPDAPHAARERAAAEEARRRRLTHDALDLVLSTETLCKGAVGIGRLARWALRTCRGHVHDMFETCPSGRLARWALSESNSDGVLSVLRRYLGFFPPRRVACLPETCPRHVPDMDRLLPSERRPRQRPPHARARPTPRAARRPACAVGRRGAVPGAARRGGRAGRPRSAETTRDHPRLGAALRGGRARRVDAGEVPSGHRRDGHDRRWRHRGARAAGRPVRLRHSIHALPRLRPRRPPFPRAAAMFTRAIDRAPLSAPRRPLPRARGDAADCRAAADAR